MAARRLSKLQSKILAHMDAWHERPQDGISNDHAELVKALGHDKGNISRSLRRLERRGLITVSRSQGGQADSLDLTQEGRKIAQKLT